MSVFSSDVYCSSPFLTVFFPINSGIFACSLCVEILTISPPCYYPKISPLIVESVPVDMVNLKPLGAVHNNTMHPEILFVFLFLYSPSCIE